MTEEAVDLIELTLPADAAGKRLDRALADALPAFSRSRLKTLIEAGEVTLNGQIVDDASMKVKGGERVELDEPLPIDADPEPENIPLDIVYEDDDLLVINKDADMVVHPAAGHRGGTLVNALLHHCGDTLSGIGGVKRPGIVHRLDRGTSGLMVVAKTDAAHRGLQDQLADRSLGRVYHAFVLGVPIPPMGTINRMIGRHPTHRLKMTVRGRDGREAITHYKILERFQDVASLVECQLETGRTHQIRVHFEALGYRLLGDPLYGPQPTAVRAALKRGGASTEDIDFIINFPRQALHAAEIHFIHPTTEEEMEFEIGLPEDLEKLYNILKKL